MSHTINPYERFQIPVEGEQYPSEYDLGSAMLQDAISRDVAPIIVQTLDMTAAGTLVLNVPGRAFVPYFWQAGTVNRLRVANVSIRVRINDDVADKELLCPNNRGYRGSFYRLYLSWDSQPGVNFDFVILRSWRDPWMTDNSR